jgi:hypothetical protein
MACEELWDVDLEESKTEATPNSCTQSACSAIKDSHRFVLRMRYRLTDGKVFHELEEQALGLVFSDKTNSVPIRLVGKSSEYRVIDWIVDDVRDNKQSQRVRVSRKDAPNVTSNDVFARLSWKACFRMTRAGEFCSCHPGWAKTMEEVLTL